MLNKTVYETFNSRAGRILQTPACRFSCIRQHHNSAFPGTWRIARVRIIFHIHIRIFFFSLFVKDSNHLISVMFRNDFFNNLWHVNFMGHFYRTLYVVTNNCNAEGRINYIVLVFFPNHLIFRKIFRSVHFTYVMVKGRNSCKQGICSNSTATVFCQLGHHF